MPETKSQVRRNAELDSWYAPYCLACRSMARMAEVSRFFWRCTECGAEHDERTADEMLGAPSSIGETPGVAGYEKMLGATQAGTPPEVPALRCPAIQTDNVSYVRRCIHDRGHVGPCDFYILDTENLPRSDSADAEDLDPEAAAWRLVNRFTTLAMRYGRGAYPAPELDRVQQRCVELLTAQFRERSERPQVVAAGSPREGAARHAYVMAMAILQSNLWPTYDDELRTAVNTAIDSADYNVIAGRETTGHAHDVTNGENHG